MVQGGDGVLSEGYARLLGKDVPDERLDQLCRELVPSGKAYWFAFREQASVLPQRLEDVGDAVTQPWEELRIFWDAAELTVEQRGRGNLVLLWSETSWDDGEPAGGPWEAVKSRRFLRGTAPQEGLPGYPEAWVEVRCPRPLDYRGLAAEQGRVPRAEVWEYRERGSGRLIHVRYAGLRTGRKEVRQNASS